MKLLFALFGVALLAPCMQAANPKLWLVVDPYAFEVNKEFNYKCSLNNFEENEIATNYTVLYTHTPKTGDQSLKIAIGGYLVMMATDGTPTPTFIPSALDYLKVEAGNMTFPNYTLVVTPQSDDARGQYQCWLQSSLTTDLQPSNIYNSSFGIAPSVTLLALSILAAIKLYSY